MTGRNDMGRPMPCRMARRVVLLCGVAVLMSATGCRRASRDEALMHEAQTFTRNECPKRIDRFTVMDSMTYAPESRTMTYSYTIDGDLDNAELYTASFLEQFRSDMVRDVKNSIALRRMKENRLTFVYRYVSQSTGLERVVVGISAEDYE